MNREELVEYLNKNRKHIKINLLKVSENLNLSDVHYATFYFEVRFTQRTKFYFEIEYDKVDKFNSFDLDVFRSILENKILKEL